MAFQFSRIFLIAVIQKIYLSMQIKILGKYLIISFGIIDFLLVCKSNQIVADNAMLERFALSGFRAKHKLDQFNWEVN